MQGIGKVSAIHYTVHVHVHVHVHMLHLNILTIHYSIVQFTGQSAQSIRSWRGSISQLPATIPVYWRAFWHAISVQPNRKELYCHRCRSAGYTVDEGFGDVNELEESSSVVTTMEQDEHSVTVAPPADSESDEDQVIIVHFLPQMTLCCVLL